MFSSRIARTLRYHPSLFSSLLHRVHRRPRGTTSQGALELRTFPRSGFEVVDPSILLEEESLSNYKAERFYPVKLGDVLNDRYQISGKLGYGVSSTVWLCRDFLEHRYVTLKVYVNTCREHKEIPMYKHIDQVQSDFGGRECIRKLLDYFEISGPHGRHMCLVHQPLSMSFYEMKQRARGKVFTTDMLKICLRQILLALVFLHREAHVVHTDIQPGNLLMGVRDESIFSEYVQDECDYPVPRKVLSDRIVYASRPVPLTTGVPVLCDLGEARFGDEEHREDIMPTVYRSPEVILGMEWSYKVDIWGLAMTAWELMEHQSLFKGKTMEGEYDPGVHLAEMIAILGPAPPEFLKRTENSLRYWDEEGNWRGLLPIPEIDMETMEEQLEGDNKKVFLQFLRSMIRWIPEERPTAEEAIYDDWLMEGLIDPAPKES